MSEKVWIFGDSYAYRNEHFATWPVLIEKFYDVTNFARGGSGPDFTLEKLYHNVYKEDTSNTVAIFFLSDIYRQNWCWWDDASDKMSHQFLSVDLLQNKWFLDNSDIRKLKKKYIKKKSFIKGWLESQKVAWSAMEHQKQLGMINLWAPAFKKILVIYCFEKPDLTKIKLHSNVYVASQTMLEVQPYHEYDIDPNPNHLPLEKHPKFLKTLRSWIDNDVQI